MKRIKSIILMALAVLCIAQVSHADEGVTWCYTYLMLTETRQLGARRLQEFMHNNAEHMDEGVLDVVAELVLRHHSDENYHLDNINWYIEILGRSKNGRYKSALTQVGEEAAHKKIAKRARKYGKKLPEGGGASYTKGDVDLDAFVPQVMERAAQRADAESVDLKSVRQRDHLSSVIEKVGLPDSVVMGAARASLLYRGSGRVALAPKNGIGWVVAAVNEDPLAFEFYMPEYTLEGGDGDFDALYTKVMLYGSPLAKRETIKELREKDNVTQEQLDLAATLLLEGHDKESTAIEVDLYSWICKLLLTHGEGRYKTMLTSIEESASHEKLQKYIGKVTEDMPTAEGSEFAKPVDMASLRVEYPSPIVAR